MFRSLALILVSMCSPGFVASVFTFSSMSRIFFSILMILSLICLFLSSSSFIFTMVEFIPWSCVPTESVIVCRNLSIFSSDFLIASIISLCRNIDSSLVLVDLPLLVSSSFLFFFLSSSVFDKS